MEPDGNGPQIYNYIIKYYNTNDDPDVKIIEYNSIESFYFKFILFTLEVVTCVKITIILI